VSDPKKRPRVGLFVTCLVDIFRPTVGLAAVKLAELRSVGEGLGSADVGRRKRDKCMTAPIKRKSHRVRKPAQAAAMTPWS
jgi:hypothetical protein